MLGLIGKKVGMTQVFDEQGRLTPVTVIKIEDNVVIANRTEEKNGYCAAVIGSGDRKKSQTTKPFAGQFADVTAPKQTVMEFRDFDNEVKVGDVLGVDLFKDVAFVDVTGTSKGKGYQGVIKRYGKQRGPEAHGSGYHRGVGSMGACSYPGKVMKGKKLPGHFGVETVTVQNLDVVKVDEEKNLILVKGAVPGPKGGIVTIKNTVKCGK